MSAVFRISHFCRATLDPPAVCVCVCGGAAGGGGFLHGGFLGSELLKQRRRQVSGTERKGGFIVYQLTASWRIIYGSAAGLAALER